MLFKKFDSLQRKSVSLVKTRIFSGKEKGNVLRLSYGNTYTYSLSTDYKRK